MKLIEQMQQTVTDATAVNTLFEMLAEKYDTDVIQLKEDVNHLLSQFRKRLQDPNQKFSDKQASVVTALLAFSPERFDDTVIAIGHLDGDKGTGSLTTALQNVFSKKVPEQQHRQATQYLIDLGNDPSFKSLRDSTADALSDQDPEKKAEVSNQLGKVLANQRFQRLVQQKSA